MEKKLNCDRCGKEITIEEWVKNSKTLWTLGLPLIFHFCGECIYAIQKEEGVNNALY